MFQFFLQRAKSVYKMQKPLGNFLLVYSFSSVFSEYVCKNYSSFSKYVPVRSTKLSSVVFQWFTLNLSSFHIINMKLKKIVNYRKRSQYQTTFIYKKHLIKELSCSRRGLEFLYRTQSWTRFHYWWLLWKSVLRCHCF